MITISGVDKKLNELRKAVEGVERDFKKNLAVVINDTARYCKSQISKEIQGTGVNLTQKVIKAGLKDSGRANRERVGVEITLKKDYRFGLDKFKARQTKKGVSYRISKTSGLARIPNAFIPAAYGGKVYVRQGKARGPLRQMRGISPWGAFVKNDKTSLIEKKTRAELEKQLDRRIRLLLLRAEGKVK